MINNNFLREKKHMRERESGNSQLRYPTKIAIHSMKRKRLGVS